MKTIQLSNDELASLRELLNALRNKVAERSGLQSATDCYREMEREIKVLEKILK